MRAVSGWARTYAIATILGMVRWTDVGRENVAVVIDADGRIQGVQTKNQLDPGEDPHYVPGTTRQLFQVNGVRFGVAICHEGWRYPETVRWAAARGPGPPVVVGLLLTSAGLVLTASLALAFAASAQSQREVKLGEKQYPAGQVGLLFVDFGRPSRLRLNGIASIDADDPLTAEYTFADTAEEQWKLAEWCRDKGLSQQRTFHMERVIDLTEKQSRFFGLVESEDAILLVAVSAHGRAAASVRSLDDVAADFPGLTVILAHPSVPWQDEAISIATHKANVYIDLSGWSPKYFPPQLVRAANTMLKHKVLFGSEFGAKQYPQFRPHRGASSYWFFQTVERNQDEIGQQWREMADEIIDRWNR